MYCFAAFPNSICRSEVKMVMIFRQQKLLLVTLPCLGLFVSNQPNGMAFEGPGCNCEGETITCDNPEDELYCLCETTITSTSITCIYPDGLETRPTESETATLSPTPDIDEGCICTGLTLFCVDPEDYNAGCECYDSGGGGFGISCVVDEPNIIFTPSGASSISMATLTVGIAAVVLALN